MYSQCQEEKHILEYFSNRIGTFADIGAYHPTVFSNTRRLVEMGWSGTMWEPDPNCFPHLENEYKDNPKIILHQKALITTQEPKVKWYHSRGDALSSTKEYNKIKWAKDGVVFDEMEVEAMYVGDVDWTQFNFINIDTEGTSISLLKSINFDKTDLVCIEFDYVLDEVIAHCRRFGLINFIYSSGENMIMER